MPTEPPPKDHPPIFTNEDGSYDVSFCLDKTCDSCGLNFFFGRKVHTQTTVYHFINQVDKMYYHYYCRKCCPTKKDAENTASIRNL